MDSGCSKGRMNVEDDRISLLPDDLIHKILSFISIKQAVQMCALSSRWRFIWTSMPYLNMSTHDFSVFSYFSKFVNHVLTRRNNQIEVYSVKFTFEETYGFREAFSEAFLKQILDYAFSHDLQQLTVTCLLKEEIDFPIYLFRSPSLKYLRLTGCEIGFFEPCSLILASTWDLPALTTLHLDYVSFYDDSLFSKCANLKNLTLSNFRILKSNTFTLSHPQISNLTLEDEHWDLEAVNVVAHQLENICIRIRHFGRSLITITAPKLVNLLFHGSRLLQLFTDLDYLEKVDLCITSAGIWNGFRIAALLQQLHNVKFLTFNLEFIEPLISCMENFSPQPISPFSNLKSLKIYPVYVLSDDKRVIMSTKVLNYLRDGSPSATVTLISYEEIKEKWQKAQAIANATEAQRLMANLQVALEKEKADIETNTTCMRQMENSTDNEEEKNTDDQDKALVEKMQLHVNKRMTQMKICCEDVSARIDKGKRNTDYIISWLRDIEIILLKDLSDSKRDELQTRFSSLCEEVDTFVKKTVHYMMIPQVQLSDSFNELATSSLSSLCNL